MLKKTLFQLFLSTFSLFSFNFLHLLGKLLGNVLFDRKSIVTECALVPLTCNSLKGLIALGTDIPKKYDSKKDTLFLDFVSEVVSKLIDSHNV